MVPWPKHASTARPRRGAPRRRRARRRSGAVARATHTRPLGDDRLDPRRRQRGEDPRRDRPPSPAGTPSPARSRSPRARRGSPAARARACARAIGEQPRRPEQAAQQREREVEQPPRSRATRARPTRRAGSRCRPSYPFRWKVSAARRAPTERLAVARDDGSRASASAISGPRASDEEQREQARHDAREASPVEVAEIDLREGRSLDRALRDEEARDDEEDEDRFVAVPAHRAQHARREEPCEHGLLERKTNSDVMKHDEENRDAAQGIDALDCGCSRPQTHERRAPFGTRLVRIGFPAVAGMTDSSASKASQAQPGVGGFPLPLPELSTRGRAPDRGLNVSPPLNHQYRPARAEEGRPGGRTRRRRARG